MNEDIIPYPRLLWVAAARVEHWNHPSLTAPFWRFYWNRTPGAGMTLGGRTVAMGPGEAWLIPPETPFASQNRGAVEHFYVHFALEPAGAPPPGLYPLPAEREFRRRAGAVTDHFLRGGAVTLPVQLEVLSFIHHALAGVDPAWLRPMRRDPRVEQAMRRMAGDVAQALPNARLAVEAHMNTNAFIRLFSRQVGMSPQEYFTVRRIERACVLLHSSAAGIKEIAAATGFCDRYHFTRVFRRLRGVPPAEFRRRTCGAADPGRAAG